MSASIEPLRLVIDTDPGVDDALALMMAVAHRTQGVRVEAVTTVAGNVGLECTTPNAGAILDVMGVSPDETPVFAGCAHSLVGPNVRAIFHGTDGLGDCGLGQSSRRVEREHAALALIRLADEAPGALTLVALGPLTNLALATRLDPSLPGKYKRLVVMGGNILGAGNMPNTSEFNIFVDPEAAAVVFDSWPGLWLVSWETTVKHRLSPAKVEALLNAGSPRAEFHKAISQGMLRSMVQEYGELSMHAADSLAMAVALDPGLVTRTEFHAVNVELGGRHTRGHTIVDWNDYGDKPAHVNVVIDLDADRLWAMLQAAVA